ncbi:hypothetical protein KM043_002426 [Ampulex compressa]|nr:hypothetical protein KM043_002426 [Ampulex compressa]
MKNGHPIITATTSSPVGPDSSSSAEPIIRLKLDKPLHWEWELTTSADALPVIQLLDKEGRLLVETTGRTAQRARGSFREGLRSHEEFPAPSSRPLATSSSFSSSSTATAPPEPRGNRNFEGFSTKFGACNFGPRKSRSEASVGGEVRRARQREEGARREERSKRYSAGDYLRQQIMNDLRTRSAAGRSAEEMAKDRCKKVKAYLRSQSEILPELTRLEPAPKRGAMKEETRSVQETRLVREVDKDRLDAGDGLEEIEEERNERAKSRSGENPSISRDSRSEELKRIKAFLREKLERRMEEERQLCSRAQSRANVPTTSLASAIRKRHSDYRQDEARGAYRTRKVRSETSIVRFEDEALERPSRGARRSERETTKRARDPWENPCAAKQRIYRRSRSDVILESAEPLERRPRRDSSSLEKRKVYRKTKSDALLGQVNSSLDSEKESALCPVRHARSQDNIERSWREYKERKRHEKLHREPEREVAEEDFMSKPRWKDLQAELCSVRNCKVCQNLRNCVNPLQAPKEAGKLDDRKNLARLSSTEDRPGTSLQENYLVVEPKENASPLIAKVQVNDRSYPKASLLSLNSPDCGYNSIPKRNFKDYRELYSHSNVKKSDTFKIVDGSEDPEEGLDVFDSSESFGDRGANGDPQCGKDEGLLANKSNEDIAKDYFKRVYELLKKRQEQSRAMAEVQQAPGHDDSSSSNYVGEVQRRKQRRRKRDRALQGKKPGGKVESASNNQTSQVPTALP